MFALGCSNTVALRYAPTRDLPPSDSPPLVIVRGFEDRRSKGASELGVVRGGYGNILKRIYTERPVADHVTEAFRDALASRGLLAEREAAAIALGGTITKLDCNHFMRREAHTALDLVLTDIETDTRIFKRSYGADETDATVATGVLSSTDSLAALAERSLKRTIDEVLVDPEFLALATRDPNSAKPRSQGTGSPPRRSTEDRLRELDRLLGESLITNDEYKPKRNEILDDL